MDKLIMSLGLKKAALVLHALALKLDDKTASEETMSLVRVVSEAAKDYESHPGVEQAVGDGK